MADSDNQVSEVHLSVSFALSKSYVMLAIVDKK